MAKFKQYKRNFNPILKGSLQTIKKNYIFNKVNIFNKIWIFKNVSKKFTV